MRKGGAGLLEWMLEVMLIRTLWSCWHREDLKLGGGGRVKPTKTQMVLVKGTAPVCLCVRGVRMMASASRSMAAGRGGQGAHDPDVF